MEVVQTCDACGAVLGGHRVEGMAEVSLIQCGCGLVITSPRPAPDELGQHYPATYYSYVPRAVSRKSRFLAKFRAYKCGYPAKDGLLGRMAWRVLVSLVGKSFQFYLPYLGPGKSLLEIGCGTGDDLEWARQNGWSVHGLELNESAVEYAKKRGLDVQHSTFENANLSANSFDCIFMSQVLEHLYSPTLALQRCYELLRPGGSLIVGVPKFDSWTRHAMGNYWHCLLFPIHLYHFCEPVLERMVRDAGFRVREVRYSSKLLSFYYALRGMKQFRIPGRIFTRPCALSDRMVLVAEKLV